MRAAGAPDDANPGGGDLVALVPAAGFATRMGELPCSKELLPLGWRAGLPLRGEPIAAHLLRRLAAGGVRRALIVVRREKGDIPEHLGDGRRWGVELDYLVVEATGSSVETLDAAYERVRGGRVALGYPDILFHPADAYARVAERQLRTGAPVALGLFPCRQPERSDMVELEGDGSVAGLVIKRPDQGLRYTWSIAVWGSEFTECLHHWAAAHGGGGGRELYVGDVIQAALEEGMRIEAVPFETGESTDLGTPEAMADPPDWAITG